MYDRRQPPPLSIRDAFELINIAISTCTIESLKTPYSPIRPSMHSILVGQIGSLKSSILRIICDKYKTIPTFNLSSANILGSVDKNTGIPILPTIWECRNSILPIDEFYIDCHNNSQRSALHVFLSVLENPHFRKKIAYRVNDYEKKSNGLFCKMSDGTIEVKTRFTLVANTMMNLFSHQRNIEMEALKTRCLLIPYNPTIMELRSMISGENIFKIKPKKVPKNIKIDKKTYKKILDLVSNFDLKPEFYARTVGDICRAYSVVGFDDRIFQTILKLRSFTPK